MKDLPNLGLRGRLLGFLNNFFLDRNVEPPRPNKKRSHKEAS